jgi:hypothetical protein
MCLGNANWGLRLGRWGRGLRLGKKRKATSEKNGKDSGFHLAASLP